MLRYAVQQVSGPAAIRYPKGGEGRFREDTGAVKTSLIRTGGDITLIGYGTMVNQLLDCADRLAERGIQSDIVKLNTITPIDLEPILASLSRTKRMLCAEESALPGCVGQRLAAAVLEHGVPVERMALVNLGQGFVTHGTVSQLRELCGLDGEHLYQKALEVCGYGEQ